MDTGCNWFDRIQDVQMSAQQRVYMNTLETSVGYILGTRSGATDDSSFLGCDTVVGRVITDVSEGCSVFIFKSKAVKYKILPNNRNPKTQRPFFSSLLFCVLKL
jgi:hypothetical protein